MNLTASHLAVREDFRGAVENGRLLLAGGGRDKEKADHLVFLWAMEEFCDMDHLTTADQGIPDWLVKIIFLGEVETAVWLVIKFWFGNVGLAKLTPSKVGLLSLFCNLHAHSSCLSWVKQNSWNKKLCLFLNTCLMALLGDEFMKFVNDWVIQI